MQPLPPPKNPSALSGMRARDYGPRRNGLSSPRDALESAVSAPAVPQLDSSTAPTKKRRHRGGRKRKNRRQSFAAPPSEISTVQSNAETMPTDPLIEAPGASPPSRQPFYRVRSGHGSSDSLDSSALLDHRDQPMIRARRESRLTPGLYSSSQKNDPFQLPLARSRSGGHRRRLKSREHLPSSAGPPSGDDLVDDDDDDEATDKTPLIAAAIQHRTAEDRSYGLFSTKSRASSKASSNRRANQLGQSYPGYETGYDVNNPPSMPGSPQQQQQTYDNLADGDFLSRSNASRKNMVRDALIDVDPLDDRDDDEDDHAHSTRSDFRPGGGMQRHSSARLPVDADVCFPGEAESEMGFEDYGQSTTQNYGQRRRSRRRAWPQLWVLDEWSQQEKEQRAEVPGAKKISEPVLIEGRLRPKKRPWHRLDEDAPYRYTYFNEEFETTIHSQTISELVQPGGTFKELFVPEPPLLEESSDSEDDTEVPSATAAAATTDRQNGTGPTSPKGPAVPVGLGEHSASRVNSMVMEGTVGGSRAPSVRVSAHSSGEHTPAGPKAEPKARPPRYGPRPTFWLDVMSPTEQEMRVLCKAFGIHALTSEDIMMQEAREKVELFRNYYFINYRTFEQDPNSEDYLDPINMYVIVFRQGILTFHFSQIPHPANVRRRIRQLSDYLILSSDWISYAIIDDITDVYQPLIHNIEQEVDDIDELILRAFSDTNELALARSEDMDEKQSDAGEKGPSGIDMLRRVGECRKKVMALYRLLGNKADVIKGFAKRCNEQWEVAPKTEIGLYLGDIQDHILTMTSNLSHYETLLSRAHSNYLAQVSIRMNERQEQTSDVLGKLTVIGTIVLPMNIICGMWGMNVRVPGQDVENLNWFWSITAGLIVFALVCYFVCKKMYRIV